MTRSSSPNAKRSASASASRMADHRAHSMRRSTAVPMEHGGAGVTDRDPFVTSMALVRFLSASIEATAAFLMLRGNRVDTALRINGLLGLVGPTILLATTALGVVGLSGRIQAAKIGLIFMGVYLI